ncbi:MAG: Ig-like domain-containing protein [Pirellulaceae bacterium]|jgi:hypothetical protein
MLFKIFTPALAIVLTAALLPAGMLQAQNPTVSFTSPAAGAQLRPGTTIRVATNSSVVRVEYSIGANSYSGLVENYLGASTTTPYAFTWNGFASSVDLGNNLVLVARAFDRNDRVATTQLAVVVPGSVGSRVSPAKNFSASAYWLVKNLNGASLAGIGYQSTVRSVTRLDNAGEAGEFTLNAPVAGNYEITIRQYVLSGTKPSFSVAVNDTVVAPSLPGVRTLTAWNNFGAADVNRAGITTITANLVKGDNKIKITSLSSGVLNIGNVSIAQPGQ